MACGPAGLISASGPVITTVRVGEDVGTACLRRNGSRSLVQTDRFLAVFAGSAAVDMAVCVLLLVLLLASVASCVLVVEQERNLAWITEVNLCAWMRRGRSLCECGATAWKTSDTPSLPVCAETPV